MPEEYTIAIVGCGSIAHAHVTAHGIGCRDHRATPNHYVVGLGLRTAASAYDEKREDRSGSTWMWLHEESLLVWDESSRIAARMGNRLSRT